jgi:hypothetical protein
MFDRLTPEAQAAVIDAQETARAHAHHRIGPEYLRSALQGEGPVPRADEHESLARLGMAEVDAALQEPPPPIPFDEEVKDCLIRALELAGDGEVGVGHLLAALAPLQ